jgi:hypothetical protein
MSPLEATYPKELPQGTWEGPGVFVLRSGTVCYTAAEVEAQLKLPHSTLHRAAAQKEVNAFWVPPPYRAVRPRVRVYHAKDAETFAERRKLKKAEWAPDGNTFEPGRAVEGPWTDEAGVTRVTDAWLVKNKPVSKFWPTLWRGRESRLRPGEPALRHVAREAGPHCGRGGPRKKKWNRLDDAEAILAGKECSQQYAGKGAAAGRRRGELYQRIKDFLLTTLKDGPVRSPEVYRRAMAAGIKRGTLDKRRGEEGITTHPVDPGSKIDVAYWWCLPGQSPPTPNGPRHSDAEGEAGIPPGKDPAPRWDAARRQLCLGDRPIKTFGRQSADSQVALVEAFERAGWADRIDNPFVSRGPAGRVWPDNDKLRDTCKNLNKTLPPGSIRFERDGTGQGVRWRPC